MRFEQLASKRVAVLGLGREGQAVWRQVRSRYPQKSISLFAEVEADNGFIRMLDPSLDHCHFGPFNVDQLKQYEVLVRSAGISPYREEIQQLHKLGVQFTTANNLWFAENPDANTICITGTNGKSTTAALTAHMLKHAGLNVCLAGNIGRPALDCDSKDVDWWVVELSSYQITDLEATPDFAIFLNLSDEHIDWHGNAERYRADKLRLADMTAAKGLIANACDSFLRERLADFKDISWFNGAVGWKAGKDRVVYHPLMASGAEGENPEIEFKQVFAPDSLPGGHNMQNLAAVLTLLDALELDIRNLDQVLAEFTGLPHRLQLLGVKDGIKYVDDSISTTPVSVEAALRTIGTTDVVLLLGGLDRGLDWNDFAQSLSKQPTHAVVTMPDNGTKILSSLVAAGVDPVGGLHAVSSLYEAVALAQNLVPENGCVLLSPGAPSFPHFRDFEDRGNQFAKHAGIEKSTLGTH